MASIQKLFPGIQVYDKAPVEVRNPFSGESITLSPKEVAVYDYLKGCEMMRDYILSQRHQSQLAQFKVNQQNKLLLNQKQ